MKHTPNNVWVTLVRGDGTGASEAHLGGGDGRGRKGYYAGDDWSYVENESEGVRRKYEEVEE